jgi:cell division protein FtsI/penicillin-binding protein 2
VRLSLDLTTQAAADVLLGGQKAALVLINAENGEILVMSSHPNFNPNTLEADWERLMQSKDAPFLNRAAQAVYPLGAAAAPFLLAATVDSAQLPALPADLGTCTPVSESAAEPATWGEALAAGCTGAAAALARTLGSETVQAFYEDAGFFALHPILLPVEAGLPVPTGGSHEATALDASLSPLNLAVAAASISAQGARPQPLLALDLRLPGEAWRSFTTYQPAEAVFSPRAAQDTMRLLADPFHLAWHTVAMILPEDADQTAYTWFVGGSSPGWQGSPLALALVIEGNQPDLALLTGLQVLQTAMQP